MGKNFQETPVWYDAQAPVGSAVRYIASLSGLFNWVGFYALKGKTLVLGPFLGENTDHKRIPVGRGVCGRAVSEDKDLNVPDVTREENYLACSLETRSELVVLVRDREGKVVGQIDIDSHTADAFGPEEQRQVKRVARELGEVWPG